MNRRLIGNYRGVCLAEVMIALAAGAVVLAATLQSLDHFQHRLSKQHVTAAQAQDLRIGLKVLEDELRAIAMGSSSSETSLSITGRQEIEFSANLGGFMTTLTSAVSSLQQDLPVVNGTDWPKGKRILVCDRERCAEGRLSRDGRKALLNIAVPLGHEFATGSEVRVVNRVRYYVKTDQDGTARVMREVDGGANPLIGEIAKFQLGYFDRTGAATTDPSLAARVRIEAAAGDSRNAVVQEIALRGR